jgi:hypothetical protein
MPVVGVITMIGERKQGFGKNFMKTSKSIKKFIFRKCLCDVKLTGEYKNGVRVGEWIITLKK